MIKPILKRSSGSAPTKSVWLVSFGDLLTLLLCLFLALVGNSGLNPHKANQISARSKEQISSNGAFTASDLKHGTRLALNGSAKRSIRLVCFERDFKSVRGELRRSALIRLQNEARSVRYSSQAALIEGCALNQSEQSRFESMKRRLTLRSQMIDSGFLAERLSIRAMGADCSQLGAKNAVARLRYWKL